MPSPRRKQTGAAAPTEEAAESQQDPFGSPDDEFETDLQIESDLPNGVYPAKVADIRKQESKKGNPMWVFDFVISDGPHAGSEVPCFCALTPAALWKLGDVVRGLGVPVETVNGKPKVKFNRADLIGNRVFIGVEKSEGYDPSVSDVYPAANKAAKTKAEAMMKAQTAALATDDEDEVADEDDMPF
jgi:hypothetical protein